MMTGPAESRQARFTGRLSDAMLNRCNVRNWALAEVGFMNLRASQRQRPQSERGEGLRAHLGGNPSPSFARQHAAKLRYLSRWER